MRKVFGALVGIAIAATPAWATGVIPTVVPEPATVALMAGGMAMLGVLAWKRNRKK